MVYSWVVAPQPQEKRIMPTPELMLREEARKRYKEERSIELGPLPKEEIVMAVA